MYSDFEEVRIAFNHFSDDEKRAYVAQLIDTIVEYLQLDIPVVDFTMRGTSISIDGFNPCHSGLPTIWMFMFNNSPMGITVSEMYPDSFMLGCFKNCTRLDEISGCELPIELKPWVEEYLNNRHNF